MKAKAKQYAQVLFDLTKDGSEAEIKKQTKKFASILLANNQASQINKIIDHFKIIWNREKGIIEAKIIGAHEIGKEAEKSIEAYLKLKTNVDKIEVEKIIDEKLLGGLIIRLGDKIIDKSLKTKINKFKQELAK